jgi:flagellar biosynthetic protein FlhB
LGNILSARSGLELGKAIGKAAIVATVALIVIWHQKEAVLALGLEPFKVSIAHLGDLLWTSFLVISGALLLIALVDAPYQVWHHANKLRMTRDQLRRETRESEGDPHIKARIRAQQREMARRRMISEIPNADVVVTNPMHYAVALRYGDGATGAPRVVAKGADEVASRIREIATENGVPLLEAPPLARALYRHTDLGDEIPEALYTAVAEVLAYVFQLRMFRQRGGVRPVAPSRLAVPPHLDPLNDPRADFSDREPTE